MELISELETIFKGWSIDVLVEGLSPCHCLAFLNKFFEHVTKKDGSLYLTQTIMSLYRAFHHILKRPQDSRVQNSRYKKLPFSMRTSFFFNKSVLLSLQWKGKKTSSNVPQKKTKAITFFDRDTILNHPCTNLMLSRGLHR